MLAFRTILVLLFAAPFLCAQDMPLAQILIPGEGWVAQPDVGMGRIAPLVAGNSGPHEYKVSGRTIEIRSKGDPESKRIMSLPEGLKSPSILRLSPDGGTLLVGDAVGKYVWFFRVQKDGSLDAGEKYITLRVLPYVAKTLKEKAPPEPDSGTSDIDFDKAGRIYVATAFGVQVFDPTGRLCGVLTSPEKGPIRTMQIVDDHLYIDFGKSLYRRKLNTTAASRK